jgi:hypothetical protein
MTFMFREPTLIEILSDPITQAVMQADSVDQQQLKTMLREIEMLRRAASISAAARDAGVIVPLVPFEEESADATKSAG